MTDSDSQFDVFLSHNSKDKPTVRRLAKALKERGITYWLDEEQLRPGLTWQGALEDIITDCNSAIVCFGEDGLGPWQEPEMLGLVRRFIKDKKRQQARPVIPVLLPGAPEQVDIPVFLEAFTWVDLRDGLTDESLDRLEWGITGKKAERDSEREQSGDDSVPPIPDEPIVHEVEQTNLVVVARQVRAWLIRLPWVTLLLAASLIVLYATILLHNSIVWRSITTLVFLACTTWCVAMLFSKHRGRVFQAIGLVILSVVPAWYAAFPQPVVPLITLKPIPAGTFMRGSDSDVDDDEKPQKPIKIDAFQLGIYEVTQEQYEQVMGTNPSQFKGDSGRPVESVSWHDASEFCNRLSDLKKFDRYYLVDGQNVTIRGGNGYRLPTEAEWEYACRAGSSTKYFFGDDEEKLRDYAWYMENADRQTQPVGQKQPNDWGLYDMHGNVWEWCWDWYDENYYEQSPPENPTGPSQGSYRVNRGGGWDDVAGFCQSSNRYRYYPTRRFNGLGFRVARSSE